MDGSEEPALRAVADGKMLRKCNTHLCIDRIATQSPRRIEAARVGSVSSNGLGKLTDWKQLW